VWAQENVFNERTRLSGSTKILNKNLTKIMKMAVIWDIEPCSLVDIDQCFKELTAFFIKAMIQGPYRPNLECYSKPHKMTLNVCHKM
jgi:hypothetical protein